ncbi:hypothetical protein [Vibrio phage XZ1]|uniref:Uncharacterized protein n=3 Tax=Schizotequatrovirus TaxID=1198137 RepID=A0A126HH48_9CAUD|nr:hypothetical protein CF80_gp179 [Vibrio phage VH7D]YP_009201458.1 hypothetical protein AVU32_gp355 [Vibrio phage ValKK3]ALP47195.1 hypothetical protein phiGrn1_0026 [Vibrio phage phi-Grn1]ALP47585.1 hypothetical protein phiST2_0157 [Vibrio phage phi-ST2]QBX06179.1 hypothetical protein Va3_226 [Vibrio phage Va3]QNJ54804.1 hypothetical protein vBValMR10Z_264 [Vibrio phage vB_ValM_R10Z]QNJ55191.1 hypothetical protein vBValMR11Z_265 [Vibrio phage vB_ValM_R11Z]UOL51237.1 hypothetical protein [
MAKLIDNQTVKIIDVGNFNILVKQWYELETKEITESLQLEEGEIVNIKIYDDATVPGGVYSLVTKTSKHYTTALGSIIHDRNSPDYDMKKDRHRVQITSKLN